MRLLGATVAMALFVFPLFAQAQWKFDETKDPFTDQLQRSRAFSQTTVSGSLWEPEAECYRSFGVGVELPKKTATAQPSFDVKYRIDSNPFHNSRWITPYAYSRYVAINKEDWDNILKETKDDSTLVIGFADYTDVVRFSMKEFRANYDKVINDCIKRNGEAKLY